MIKSYRKEMLKDFITLWNDTRTPTNLLIKMDEENFNKIITSNSSFDPEMTFVYLVNNKIIGLINGTILDKQDEKIGFISFIIVDNKFKGKGIGTKLLKHLENQFKKMGVSKINISFYNPIKIKWSIPNTGFIHTNLPGVSVNSNYYYFLRNQGYQIKGEIQDAYLLVLSEFQVSPKLRERAMVNKSNGYEIKLYDAQIHKNHQDFFNRLNQPSWLESFETNNRKNKPFPTLVVVKDNNVHGWLGSVFNDEDGRASFAGIGIDPLVQKNGLGKILFASYLEYSKNNKSTYSTLFTGMSNKARFIYQDLGYKVVQSFVMLEKLLE